MRYYNAILLEPKELAQTLGVMPVFKDQALTDRKLITKLENKLKEPILYVKQLPDFIVCITIPGMVTYNPVLNRRTAHIHGNYDYVRQVLTDLFQTQPDTDPRDIFCQYHFNLQPSEQQRLYEWVCAFH